MCFSRPSTSSSPAAPAANDGTDTTPDAKQRRRADRRRNRFARTVSRFRIFVASAVGKVRGGCGGGDETDEDDLDWGSAEVRAFIRPRDEEWGWNR